MKTLVTGGAGYIGSHTVKALLEQNHQVVVIDNLSRGYREVIDVLQKKYGQGNLIFYKADLRDIKELEPIIKKERPKGVLHFAALCLVTESMEKPGEYLENNVTGSLNLLRSLAQNGINKLVFSSTSAVYGENQYLPVDENHPTNPVNLYGESKLLVERMISWFGRLRQLNHVIFRYFNVSGASSEGLIGDSKKPSQLLVQNAVRGALNIEPFKLTCPSVNTRDGTPIRDYINVEDLADAHVTALNYLEQGGKSEIVNLGVGQGNSVLEIVKQVKDITGVDFPVEKGTPREGENAEIYSDISKARKVLGWQPKRTIRDSVDSLVKWYTKRPEGWDY